MAHIVFGILLAVHIGAVIAWMGSSFLFAWVIGPSLESMNPDTRTGFLLNMLPRFSKFISISSSAAIGAGIVLAGWTFGAETSLVPSGIAFFLFLIGAVLAFVALLIAMALVVSPANRLLEMLEKTKNTALPASSDETSKILELQRIMRSGAKALAAMLPVVMLLMVLGLYA